MKARGRRLICSRISRAAENCLKPYKYSDWKLFFSKVILTSASSSLLSFIGVEILWSDSCRFSSTGSSHSSKLSSLSLTDECERRRFLTKRKKKHNQFVIQTKVKTECDTSVTKYFTRSFAKFQPQSTSFFVTGSPRTPWKVSFIGATSSHFAKFWTTFIVKDTTKY